MISNVKVSKNGMAIMRKNHTPHQVYHHALYVDSQLSFHSQVRRKQVQYHAYARSARNHYDRIN